MPRVVIKTGFPTVAQTAEVLGVSRPDTQKLIRMAKSALVVARDRRGKAQSNGAKAIGKKARKRR